MSQGVLSPLNNNSSVTAIDAQNSYMPNIGETKTQNHQGSSSVGKNGGIKRAGLDFSGGNQNSGYGRGNKSSI